MKGDYLTRFVEDLLHDAGAEIVFLISFNGFVELWILPPCDFEARNWIDLEGEIRVYVRGIGGFEIVNVNGDGLGF